jgi:transcriptional regulator with XRE-family HTH domain
MENKRCVPLRIYRESRGLTLRKTAELADIDIAQLSRLEHGQGGISLEAAVRLARVLGMKDVPRVLAPFLGAAQQKKGHWELAG